MEGSRWSFACVVFFEEFDHHDGLSDDVIAAVFGGDSKRWHTYGGGVGYIVCRALFVLAEVSVGVLEGDPFGMCGGSDVY